MNRTEEKPQFKITKLRISLGSFFVCRMMLIWYLELNDVIGKSLFYVSSFAVIISAFLINYFFDKKQKVGTNKKPAEIRHFSFN